MSIPFGPPFQWCADAPNAAIGWKNIVNLLATRRKIIVLTGAGISVSCGIPDFRSKTGLYATLDAQVSKAFSWITGVSRRHSSCS